MPTHERLPYSLSQHTLSQRVSENPVDTHSPSISPSISLEAKFAPLSPVKRVGERFVQDETRTGTDFGPFPSAPTFSHELDEGADLAFLYGEQYDSYQASEKNYHQFWSAERRGFVSYAKVGRVVLVRGGLIAPPDHREELLNQFLDHTARRGMYVSFFNMSETLVPLFRKYNFRVNKWGEEPIVELSQCTFKGKPYEWVRRQTNYCQRHGLKAFEVCPSDLPPHVWQQLQIELNEVAADSISDKAQAGELKFFEGQLNAENLGYRRLFIAKSEWGEGRIEGFVVCNPLKGGESWSTEIYRRRRDSVRGTIAFLFQHVVETLREEGRKRLYLCIVPGLRCQEKIPGDSPLIRYSFQFAGPWMSCLFDLDGLTHFKSRFRPTYEKRYIFVYPRTTIQSTLAFFRVLGLFNISLANLTRVFYQRLRKCGQRRTLAKLA